MLTESQRCEISQKIVLEEYERAKKIVIKKKGEVEALAQELSEKKHLSGKEAIQIINR
jgi:ATP-dependent Zn protease